MKPKKPLSEISVLKNQIQKHKKNLSEKEKIQHALGERVKELNCLYGLSELASKKNITTDKIFIEIVKLIPPGWQYPEITCSRIIFNTKEFKTDNFKETSWKQEAVIKVRGGKSGNIGVYYLEEKLFLEEEYKLLKAIANRLGKISERIMAQNNLKESERKLRIQRDELENKNIALREILSQIEIEKKEIKDNFLSNINKIILPIINKIKCNQQPVENIKILEKSLIDLGSPFAKKISNNILKLTPREIEICNMIKLGLSSKEIANALNLSKLTIEKHRSRIRNKLGLTNSDYNLISFLNNI